MDTVIRGILPDQMERYFYAVEKIDRDMFTGAHRDLWEILTKIFDMTESIATAPALEKILEHIDLPIERKVGITETWENIARRSQVTEADFRISVNYLVELSQEEKLGETLLNTSAILDRGLEILPTAGSSQKVRKYGLEDALEYLREGVAEIELGKQGHMPEGNVLDEFDDLIAELQEGSAITRFGTGCVPIDEMTHGGPGTGELWIVGAYTRVGKSTLCINWAHEMVKQGKNVLYISLETQRVQIRRRFVVRHCLEPRFGIGGVSLDSLNKQNLTDDEQDRYISAVQDLKDNGESGEYGKFVVAQVPAYTRWNVIQALCNRWQQRMNVDVIIIDSLDLLKSDTNRSDRRDELNEVILAAKGLATSFDNGRGVPVISPWQTSRSAYQKATTDGGTGKYDITALGETSEIERRADCVLLMMEKPDQPNRLKVQTTKWRDGKPEDFEIKVDYDHGYMGSEQSLYGTGNLLLLGGS